MQSELLVAKAREEVILKDLVIPQSQFVLLALRSKILSIPAAYSRRLLNISDSKEMAAKLKAMSLRLLEELRDLPSRVTDPDWLKELEKDGDGKQGK
jgi:hypothetical protein